MYSLEFVTLLLTGRDAEPDATLNGERNEKRYKRMLEFQHIIEINDPQLAHIPALSRQQLWDGLVFRCKFPEHFTPALDCTIEQYTDDGFIRKLNFGQGHLRDRVILVDKEEIRTTPADEQQALFAQSITRIEEPAPGHLFVRFQYRRDAPPSSDSIDVAEYLKSAYVENDREAVRLLRKFAREGLPSADSRGQ